MVGATRVQIDHLFGGSALQRIDGDGRVRLPRFVRETAARRGDPANLVVAAHELDPCLIGYDPAFRQLLFAESERQRLADRPQAGRLRRLFGLSEEARIERGGRITLPPMQRRLARLDTLALFVGTGGAFEIWDPEAAAASSDAALCELARWHLSEIRSAA